MTTITRGSAGSASRTPLREGIIALSEGLPLEHGGRIDAPRVSYRLAGAADAPVVAVLGGISQDRHVSRIDDDTPEGWWEWMVGPGRPVDLDAWRVLTIDYLGGRGGSSVPPPAGAVEDGGIPLLTPGDQARALAGVASRLELGRLHGAIGASYGGAVALALAANDPERVGRVLVIGAAHESHPLATALRVIQRRIVQEAIREGRGGAGVALARALAMTTYRSDRNFAARFSNAPSSGPAGARFPVEDYLDHQGEKFSVRHAPEAFLCLSQSLDLHRVDPDRVRAPVTLVSVEPDLLAPRWQMETLRRLLGDGHDMIRIDSDHGHDAFLTEKDAFSSLVRHFLTRSGA